MVHPRSKRFALLPPARLGLTDQGKQIVPKDVARGRLSLERGCQLRDENAGGELRSVDRAQPSQPKSK